jgi:tetratricopeptide (TPR) repeat protein
MEVVLVLVFSLLLVWAVLWMRAQQGGSDAQRLIQAGQYAEALRSGDALHRGEALKLMGRFDEAAAEFEKSDDTISAPESLALVLAHSGRDLPRARRLLEEGIASRPSIQEFQALYLAYVLLQMGQREEALRIFADNALLLQTRFETDYTDPDVLLAETLYIYAVMAREAGDAAAEPLFRKVVEWAPESIFARWSSARLS